MMTHVPLSLDADREQLFRNLAFGSFDVLISRQSLASYKVGYASQTMKQSCSQHRRVLMTIWPSYRSTVKQCPHSAVVI